MARSSRPCTVIAAGPPLLALALGTVFGIRAALTTNKSGSSNRAKLVDPPESKARVR